MGKRREVIIGEGIEAGEPIPLSHGKPKIKKEKLEKKVSKEVKEKEKKVAEIKRIVKEEKKEKKEKFKVQKIRSKRYEKVKGLVESKEYGIDEAIPLIKKTALTKFDESIEAHISLGINPSKSEQNIRGIVDFPNTTGKAKKVIVISSSDKEKEAKEAGADLVGGKELIKKIEQGFMDFDVIVATPDMMTLLAKVAKILGPKGLMPTPKSGTVTMDVGKVVKSIKAGRVEFRMDPEGNIHQVIAKVKSNEKTIKENFLALLEAVLKAQPSTFKGSDYIRSITLCSTMGPGVKISIAEATKEIK